jgi:LysW-gamma-L-alpha-aminoadipyl-6-phosphate/LysW-L-glutamyl-5-phosphate reductase
MKLSAGIVGGSGYVGGEIMRLLVRHPQIELKQVTSARFTGQFVSSVHPNMRPSLGGFGAPPLKFIHPDALEPCDVLFLALPHGEASKQIDRFAGLASYIVDSSADFRLRHPEDYQKWYEQPHPAPAWLDKFVYGLPERFRGSLKGAKYATGVGCNATAVTLAIAPLADAGLLKSVVADIKVGSSEGGATVSASSHHPERHGAVRTFKAAGHRHQAEVIQSLGSGFGLFFTVTSVEMVRGVLATCHCFLNTSLPEKDLWQLYRKTYQAEPFIRLAKSKAGVYRLPEPKVVRGTNFCDVGFEIEEGTNRVVMVSAIDNLMKGAAGSAVQSMNVMLGWEETAGLEDIGLHPND